MKKKLTFIFLTSILFLGFPSCDDDMGNCPDSDEFFDINGIQVENFKGRERDYENGRNVNPLVDGESVPFENFLIRASFDVEYYPESQAFLNIDFSNKAYALSCFGNGYKGTKEQLDTLYLVTNNDFNESFAAGDTINGIVEADAPSSFWEIVEFLPLSDYVNNAQNKIETEWFQMKLTELPSFKDQSHSFTLIYHLQNGEVYSAQTENVKFQ